MPFSGHSLPKLNLRESAGDPLEWPEWSGMFQFRVGRSSLCNDEKMSHLKTPLTAAAKRSVQGSSYPGSRFNAAWSTLEIKFGQLHFIISAQLSRSQS